MPRIKVIKRGTEHYQGLSINSSYDLNQGCLVGLVDTAHKAMQSYGTALAVRLDFSLKKGIQDQYVGRSNDEINECFQAFLNRLHKLDLDMHMNWKLEWMEKKGFHVHAVFYFDSSEVKAFTVQTSVFKAFKEQWALQTDSNGNINICESSEAASDNEFSVGGGQPYTLLGDLTNVEKNRSYHLQKNKFDKKAGFIHWISYLAKTDQSIGKGKAAGKRQYRGE